jgi:hypothetical protein
MTPRAIENALSRLLNGELLSHEDKKAIVDLALAALRAFSRPGEAVQRDMDSAPKDGTPILGWVPSYYQGKGAWVVALWLGEKGMRDAGWMDNRAWLVKPSCWLPLPAAPGRSPREGEKDA